MSENTTPQGSGTLTVDTAAAAFLGMMDAAEGAESQPETEEAPEEYVEADDSELVDSEEVEEQPTRKFRVKAAGEEREVTETELIEGDRKSTRLNSSHT